MSKEGKVRRRERDLQLEQGAPSSNTVHLTLRLRHLYRVFRERKREEGGTQEKSTRISFDFRKIFRQPFVSPLLLHLFEERLRDLQVTS